VCFWYASHGNLLSVDGVDLPRPGAAPLRARTEPHHAARGKPPLPRSCAGRRRLRHTDAPPVILATTIPTSLDRALREHAKVMGRPRSEHLAAAIRAYLPKVRQWRTIMQDWHPGTLPTR
jgi:hypothetical protein